MNRYLSPKQTLIVANGERPDVSLVRWYRKHANVLIALDGAAHFLLDHDIVPDLVIGDLDSADITYLKNVPTLHVSDQNSNDLEKALIYCKKRGFHQVSVLGAFGLRADHFLTNLFVLKKFSPDLTIDFAARNQSAFVCPSGVELSFRLPLGSFISFFPLDNVVGPITSTGVLYPLSGEMLSLTSRIGTLNEITATTATLLCQSGTLLVMVPNVFSEPNLVTH